MWGKLAITLVHTLAQFRAHSVNAVRLLENAGCTKSYGLRSSLQMEREGGP